MNVLEIQQSDSVAAEGVDSTRNIGTDAAHVTTNTRKNTHMMKGKDIFGVTIIRNPRTRLVSSFLDGGGHREGMSDEEYKKMTEKWTSIKTKPRRLSNNSRTSKEDQQERKDYEILLRATDYIGHRNMIACYTKMLLGYECYSNYITRDMPFNKALLDKAVGRLRLFFFVGIFEEYETSVRLYHAVTSSATAIPFLSASIASTEWPSSPSVSTRRPHWTELRVQRATSASREVFNKVLLLTGPDPYDDVIYEEAWRLFNHTRAKYGKLLL